MDVLLPSPSIYRWAVSAAALLAFKFVVDKASSIRSAFMKIQNSPGQVSLWVRPFSALVLMLGDAFPGPGMGGHYGGKFSLYKKFGATAFASVDLYASQNIFWFADPEAIKLITSDRHTFRKDVAQYEILNFGGGNIISVDGSDWKRHRTVTMSAFNESNVALVWSESLHVMDEWLEQLEAAGHDVAVDVLSAMTQATLLVIATAGFGERVSWTADSQVEPPPGFKLTFRSAFMDSVHNVIFKFLIPEWLLQLVSVIKVPYLSSRALQTRLAFNDLRAHILDLMASARVEITSGDRSAGPSGTALLRNLVEANMNQNLSTKMLTEGEIQSNIFVFLLAGHETTTHNLCFTFVLLALYPDFQQKLYEEVIRVWPADIPISQLMTSHKEYMEKLEYTLAFIRETMRMFPSEPRLPREVCVDSVLPGTYFSPGSEKNLSVETGKFTMSIPAGSLITLDIWALHMNTLHWGEDVTEFRPDRFIDTASYQWPRNAFLPFSGGARSCIGQRFALAVMIAFIASVVRRYHIRVPDDLVKKPFEEQKKTLLKWTTGISLTPLNARVKLCRRV